MTTTSRAEARPESRIAWRPVVAVATGYAVLVQAFAGRYGLTPDEMYFRMLGERPALGYVDQPALLPLLARFAATVFGDTAWGIRVPALLCGVGVVLLTALITAEFGGGWRAQALAAAGIGTSMLVLSVGHYLLTSSVDLLAWTAIALFAARALLRDDGRWWLVAGVTCGVATYGKFVVLLLPITLLAGLVLVGPRSQLRSRWLWLGAATAVLIAVPNLMYQATHDWPQFEMARALAAADGEFNRAAFLPNLLMLLGPVLAPIWITGLVALFRRRAWRPVRALACAYLVATVLVFLAEGGRSDYTVGYLVALFAIGCVVTDDWFERGRVRRIVTIAVGAVFAAGQVVLALPVLPEDVFARYPISSLSVETVGWQRLVDQVGTVYRGLPDRGDAVLLTENFGEAGALHWLGRGLPAVYSGHNELHKWGPPPENVRVVIAVGLPADRLAKMFGSCVEVAKIDNGVGLESKEQGRPISVCRDRRAPWASLWPGQRRVGGY